MSTATAYGPHKQSPRATIGYLSTCLRALLVRTPSSTSPTTSPPDSCNLLSAKSNALTQTSASNDLTHVSNMFI